jgi:hypothetical protein
MAAITLRATSNVTQIEDLSEPFIRLRAANLPTATIAQLLVGAPPTESRLRWGEVPDTPMATAINDGAGIAADVTTLTVDSTTGMKAGCVLTLPRTREKIIVGTVASGTSLTGCTRGALGTGAVPGTTGYAILDNDVVDIGGIPHTEGYSYSAVETVGHDPDTVYNELSRAAWGIESTGTQLEFEKRGNKPYGYDHLDDYDEALFRLKREINYSALWGERYSNGLTGKSKVTAAGGIRYYALRTNTSFGDISDRTNFENNLKAHFIYSPEEYFAPCEWYTLQAIQRLYQGENIGSFNGEILKKIGIQVQDVIHPTGALVHFYHDPAVSSLYYNTTPTALGQFLVFPKANFKIHYNRAPGRYTVPPTTDSVTEQVMAEWTFSCKDGYKFGVYQGISPVS